MKNSRYIFLILCCVFLISKETQAQIDSSGIKSKIAMSIFIDGKNAEIKGDAGTAIRFYKEALKYEKAAGIHSSIAWAYLKNGRFKDAIVYFNKALEISPNNTRYLEGVAETYRSLGNLDKAAEYYERALAKDSDNVYMLYSGARIYEELNNTNKALALYERITDIYGYDPDVLSKMYNIYYEKKDYRKALEVMKGFAQLNPYDPAIRGQLASLLAETGDVESARTIFEEILRLNPQDKQVQSELVKIYFRTGESSKAFENFARVMGKTDLTFEEKVQTGELYFNSIKQDTLAKEVAKNIFTSLATEQPDAWQPYFFLSEIAFIDRDESVYRDYMQKAVALADTSTEAYIRIGFNLYDRNDVQEGRRVLSEGSIKFPDNFQIVYLNGLVLQRGGKETDAIPYFEKALQITPNDISLLSTLGLAYDNQKEYLKSEEMYERALQIDPDNPLILNNYAYNLSERNEKLDKALVMVKRAIQKEPNSASYLDTIGWIYYRMKNFKLAKENIEKSLSINPNSGVVLDHLGDVLKAMGDTDGAKRIWRKVLELNPNDEVVKNKLLD